MILSVLAHPRMKLIKRLETDGFPHLKLLSGTMGLHSHDMSSSVNPGLVWLAQKQTHSLRIATQECFIRPGTMYEMASG